MSLVVIEITCFLVSVCMNTTSGIQQTPYVKTRRLSTSTKMFCQIFNVIILQIKICFIPCQVITIVPFRDIFSIPSSGLI